MKLVIMALRDTPERTTVDLNYHPERFYVNVLVYIKKEVQKN